MKDKDLLKNRTFDKYTTRVQSLFMLPFGFQLWQIWLVNKHEQAALYRKVRVLKFLTFVGAVALGTREKLNLEYQW